MFLVESVCFRWNYIGELSSYIYVRLIFIRVVWGKRRCYFGENLEFVKLFKCLSFLVGYLSLWSEVKVYFFRFLSSI